MGPYNAERRQSLGQTMSKFFQCGEPRHVRTSHSNPGKLIDTGFHTLYFDTGSCAIITKNTQGGNVLIYLNLNDFFERVVFRNKIFVSAANTENQEINLFA